MTIVPLAPKQAADIANDVYQIRNFGIARAMQATSGLSLKESGNSGFQRPEERLRGSSGVKFFKAEKGFGFISPGTGHRQG